MDYKWLIAGLGNPGEQYATTRHNMGFFLIDAFLDLAAGRKSMRLATLKECEEYQLHSVNFGGAPCLLLRPLTYMNLSGKAVARVCGHHLMKPQQVLVAHDELDLELGRMKLKQGGSANGHNGVLSVEECLGTAAFFRLRLGIGRPAEPRRMRDFVLEDFGAEELVLARDTAGRAIQGLDILVRRGVGFAQTALHTSPKSADATEDTPPANA